MQFGIRLMIGGTPDRARCVPLHTVQVGSDRTVKNVMPADELHVALFVPECPRYLVWNIIKLHAVLGRIEDHLFRAEFHPDRRMKEAALAVGIQCGMNLVPIDRLVPQPLRLAEFGSLALVRLATRHR